VRDDLRSILAQLGGCRVLRTLDWLTEPDIPQRRALIAALLEPDGTGAGQTLQTTIQQLNRRILIGRIFSNERIEMLEAACRAIPAEVA
jgi:hypothetical protein